MKASVVITNYNYAHTLPVALASVAAQSLAFDEVIIVDDGSTDGSLDYLASQSLLPVRLLNSPRLGAAGAKHLGIISAQSPLVAILDADDELAPRFLELCASALASDPDAAYAYTDVDNRGRDGSIFAAGPYDERRLFLEANYICTGVLLRQAAYLMTPGFRMRKALEDWDLWLSFASAGMRPTYVPEPLYVYHHHEGSRGTQTSETRWLGQWIKLRHPRLVVRYAIPQLARTAKRLGSFRA